VLLHSCSLRSAVELDKAAHATFDRSFFEFAIHT